MPLSMGNFLGMLPRKLRFSGGVGPSEIFAGLRLEPLEVNVPYQMVGFNSGLNAGTENQLFCGFSRTRADASFEPTLCSCVSKTSGLSAQNFTSPVPGLRV